MNSELNLAEKLARLSHFTQPPSEVMADALEAYAARVSDLESLVAQREVRISEEVSFQRFIRKSEQETRTELTKRHEEDKGRLIRKIGFAATVHDRVIAAWCEGRKTVRVAALLAGRPDVTE